MPNSLCGSQLEEEQNSPDATLAQWHYARFIPFCKEGWLEPPLATYYMRRIERNDSNQSNP